jgi:hypothetical protein
MKEQLHVLYNLNSKKTLNALKITGEKLNTNFAIYIMKVEIDALCVLHCIIM